MNIKIQSTETIVTADCGTALGVRKFIIDPPRSEGGYYQATDTITGYIQAGPTVEASIREVCYNLIQRNARHAGEARFQRYGDGFFLVHRGDEFFAVIGKLYGATEGEPSWYLHINRKGRFSVPGDGKDAFDLNQAKGWAAKVADGRITF